MLSGCFAPGTSGTVLGIRESSRYKKSNIFGVDQFLRVNSLPDFERIIELNESNEDYYIEGLVKILYDFKVDILLPQTTRETLLLSKYYEFVSNFCKIPLASTFDGLVKANDKFLLLQHSNLSSSNKLELIPFEDENSGRIFLENAIQNNKNVFLKSRNSSGGRGIVKVVSDVDKFEVFSEKTKSFHVASYTEILEIWDSRDTRFSDYFLMDELVGEEYTVDVFIGKSNKIVIPRKRLSIRSGISEVNYIDRNEIIIKRALDLAESLNLKNLFGFQFLWNGSGEPFLLECNPRIQGTNMASVLAGTNVIEYLISEAFNLKYEVVEPKWESTFFRSSRGFIL